MDKLYIASYDMKEQLLLNKNSLSNDSYITLSDFMKKVTFHYNNDAIIYVMDKYNLSLKNARIMLDNLYVLKDNVSSKVDELISLKKEIKDYLIYDNLFIESLKNKEIICLYSNISKYEKSVLSQYNVKYLEENNKNSLSYYKLDKEEDEVSFVLNYIITLIKKGINLSSIKIICNQDYKVIVDKLSKFYNLVVDSEYDLSSSIYINNFMNNFNLEEIKDVNLYNKVINICNKYTSLSKYKDKFIINDLKKLKLNVNYEDSISYGDLFESSFQDKYVFILGFNNDFINYHKDTDYLSDFEKDKLGLETSSDYNERLLKNTISKLQSIDNLIITYSPVVKDDLASECEITHLLDMKELTNDLEVEYSSAYSKLKLASYLYDYDTFMTVNKNLDKYYNTFKIPYNTYSNKFTGIDNELLRDKYRRSVSFTSYNTFFQCRFKFYLNYVLKVDKFEETYYTMIGNFAHSVLSESYKEDFDFDKSYNCFLKNYSLTHKKLFYLNKMKDEIKDVIRFNNDFKNNTSFNNYMFEKKIGFYKYNLYVNGIIDKINYISTDDKTYLSIIDYKTGNVSVDLKNIKYGLDSQLIFYDYLVKNSDTFSNIVTSGLYLHKVIRDKGVSNKLEGYSNLKEIPKFDYTYSNSEFIKGLKLNKDGSISKNSKVISEEELNKYLDIIDNNLKLISNVLDKGEFYINPISINNKLLGCDYCPFQDICFRTYDDINNVIEEVEDELDS